MSYHFWGKVVLKLGRYGFFRFLSDEKYLKMSYRLFFGRKLDLARPKTYNEKLQWLKLYDRSPRYTGLVDKYSVKKFVAEIIGENYIIPTLGVWEKFEDIDFNSLPDKFVLKCTHDSGCVVICKDKKDFDYKAARKKLERALKIDYFYLGREWPYKNVPHRIIAEKYMVDESGYELKDYKFMCFGGKVENMFIVSNRGKKNEDIKVDFYDMDFKHLPFTRDHKNAGDVFIKPDNFEKMIELSEKLSEGIPFLRVDFYNINGKIYFGELTFFPGSGFEPFQPEEWDYKLGERLTLPKKDIE